MTPEKMMQAVVEAAEEKWHKARGDGFGCDCICGDQFSRCPRNPSHLDLNELMRLAEKLGFMQINFIRDNTLAGYWCDADSDEIVVNSTMCSTPAEALLTALYEATKEREKGKYNVQT